MRAILALIACAPLLVHAQSPAELRALLDKGDARAAYDLGRRAPERLGDPAFDLMFGIAAINAGQPGEGVLALERVVLANPGHEGARVELARGYFLLGDDVRAREEFEAALARNPPADLARVAREHLEALRAREVRYKPTVSAHLELGAGYDSNPRAGVDNPVLSLPVLGEVTIAEAGVRVSDRVGQYGGGLRVTAPLFPRVAGFAAGQAEAIRHADEKDFDQSLYAGSAGVMGQWGRAALRAGASGGYQKLGHVPYRRTHGAFADATFAVSDSSALVVGVQGGKLDYQGVNTVRDADFHALTLGWRQGLAGAWRPVIEVTANAARERNDFDDRQDLSRDAYGVRVGAACTPRPDWTLAAGATWQRSRYSEPDPILLATRTDRYAALDLTLGWNLTRALSLRLELAAVTNDSSIALYEYTRRTAFARIRHEFR